MSIKKINQTVVSEDFVRQLLGGKVDLADFNDAIASLDNQISSSVSGLYWKAPVATFDQLSAVYPNPSDGWTVTTLDTDFTYRFTGDEWIAISSNSIPIATEANSGLISKELIAKLNKIQEGAQKNLTAQELLELLKTVDGTGSGLEADLLQGKRAEDFADAEHLHDGRYYTQQQLNTMLGNKADKTVATEDSAGLMSTQDRKRSNGYVHNQVSASEVWTIEHNLNKYPQVSIVDSGGSVVFGDISHVSRSVVKVSFTSAFSGIAYVN
jgi:hypothetical protein